jgi:transposase-like protein
MGHRVLCDELIDRAGELASLGLPMLSIAKGCGVTDRAFYGWMKAAREGTGSDLEVRLLRTIQEAHTKGELKLVRRLQQLAEEGDGKAAQWMLSHGPARDSWSDASAVRRAETAILQRVADGIQSSRLTLEQQQEVLLSLRRQGLPAVEEP